VGNGEGGTVKTRLKVQRTYRIGDNTEEGTAATIGETYRCEVCDRELIKVTVLNNDLKVGAECATYLTMPEWRKDDEAIRFYWGRRNKKADAYLLANNYQ
jgi:hypothetical protein